MNGPRPIKHKTGIRRKITLLICLTSFLILAIAIACGYFWGFNLLRNTIGKERVQDARILAQAIERIINAELEDLRVHLSSPFWQEAVLNANLKYKDMSEEEMKISFSEMDRQWKDPARYGLLIKPYLDSPLSLSLKNLVQADQRVLEIILTDKHGGLVAASGEASGFFHADATWWKKAFMQGKGDDFVSGIEADGASGKPSVGIASPLRDSAGNLIGICREAIDLNSFFAPLENIGLGKTGHAVLLDDNNRIIFHPGGAPLSSNFCSEADFQKLMQSRLGWSVIKEAHIHKGGLFSAFSELKHPLLSKAGLRWYVSVDQEVEEVFAPLNTLMLQMFSLAGIMIMIVIPTGFLFSGVFVKPIKKLHEATEEVIKGNLDYEVRIRTGDELEQLSDSFNYMIATIKGEQKEIREGRDKLQELAAGLEEKVKERTRELEQSKEATLNLLEDLQETKEAITADKLKMEAMMASMLEGIIMFDAQGQLVMLNASAKRLFGFPAETEVNMDMLSNKSAILNLGLLLKKYGYKKSSFVEEITVPKGNESLVLLCQVAQVKDAASKVIGLVVVLRDITQEKEIDRMKTEFVSTVSHELRTPLSITKEGLSIVLDRITGEINEKQERILATSRDNIDRLSRIIDDLLDISKIEAGRIELKRELVNINKLVNQLASSFELKTKAKGIELKIALPEQETELYIDKDRTTQVFTNLLGNAIKFTEKGYIEIAVYDKGSQIECAVADTGVGISKEDLPLVFNKFQQFGRVAGPGEKGTGLGLSIVKNIVEMHKGRIWIDSEVGKGTKFSFVLPKYSAEELFKEYVSAGMKEAVKKSVKMTLVLVSIQDFDKLRQKLSTEQIRGILEDMETVLNRTLRKERDMVIKDTGEIIVILAECDKENAVRVKARLQEVLNEYLSTSRIAEKISLHFGCSVFPDEAGSEEDLIQKAKSSCSLTG
ncbi:MAG: ATP-binding protein [Candidatus Omnitrophota bacterium]